MERLLEDEIRAEKKIRTMRGGVRKEGVRNEARPAAGLRNRRVSAARPVRGEMDPFRTPPVKGDVDAEIRYIRGYVRLNTEKTLTLESVAKRVGLSPGYLCTMFREKTGIPFHKFVEMNRIAKAAYLLETENSLITDIAKRVGFCNASHFIAVFKNYYGMTPHIYRRTYRVGKRPDPWDDGTAGLPARIRR